jgi:hypothetical protein
MPSPLIDIITSGDPMVRNTGLDAICAGASEQELRTHAATLDAFRRSCSNLYERVRALFFLYAIHRFHLPGCAASRTGAPGHIPVHAGELVRARRYTEAIDHLLGHEGATGVSDAISSALATAYRGLALQTLGDQVRRSVRSVPGNQWLFRIGHPLDQPLRLRGELLPSTNGDTTCFPLLTETTPVRMDLTHSAWSDLFFLGMDYPEGARVINASVDLGVRGRDVEPVPPIRCFVRIIDEPVLRLVSIDLDADATLTSLNDVFDLAGDRFGAIKAAVIASGLIPPGLEGSQAQLRDVLYRLTATREAQRCNDRHLGIEIVTDVLDLPKGSRFAVSTSLMASVITACLRATNQIRALNGALTDDDRRLVQARTIIGEWLLGKGGGWQDSTAAWPGLRVLSGASAEAGDPEHGISRGRLLPTWERIVGDDADPAALLESSLVPVHGGMMPDSGPVLELVTEKYLLRDDATWAARQAGLASTDAMLDALRRGDIRGLAREAQALFDGPVRTIAPWAGNAYTAAVIEAVRERFGEALLGFVMLGGVTGGGMAFLFEPARRDEAADALPGIMREVAASFQRSLTFGVDPVVFDFAVNEAGTTARFDADGGRLPDAYYAHMGPSWLRQPRAERSTLTGIELEHFASLIGRGRTDNGVARSLLDRLLEIDQPSGEDQDRSLAVLLETLGFDQQQHRQVQADLRAGRIGLRQNRLPATSYIEDVQPTDVHDARGPVDPRLEVAGRDMIARGQAAVVTLAAGVGSRWTRGAGVVKALHPYCMLDGQYRTFLETHVAKSRRTAQEHGCAVRHVFTTSHLTHEPMEAELARMPGANGAVAAILSPGRSIGLRMIPTERDLRFAWEETPQQALDARRQKLIDSRRAAWIDWVHRVGEAADYTDNAPGQCMHPVGHWYEVPNMMLNGTLGALLRDEPNLRYLMLHNIDTLAASLRPDLLALHAQSGATLSFETITKRIGDRGGGLARVDGRVRLVEGLAMPRTDDEARLSYYNTATTWISIDPLLAAFGLTRGDLEDGAAVGAAIRRLAARMPTYIAIKDVKRRWGNGREDVYPVAQFEKLWTDMSGLPGLGCRYVVVPRERGQQLKEQSQLDGWVRDGSAAVVASLCAWD